MAAPDGKDHGGARDVPAMHAFGDDALGEHDAVALASLIRNGERDPVEVTRAAIARAHRVDPTLRAVASADYRRALREAAQPAPGPLSGVPTYVKDNTEVRGMPTGQGSAAVPARPASADNPFIRQFRSAGFTVLGKSRLPEFGLNASTEFTHDDPTCNPWDLERSSGASSGGAAALVASGVVPLAHGNDGGGSIRIPAACCGLVGLKLTRGRVIDAGRGKRMPINLISEGVLTRSVRDTAAFLAAAEDYRRNPNLPAVGHVRGAQERRLRVGLVTDSVTGEVCPWTREAVASTAATLRRLGHTVEPVELPFGERFVQDFLNYWGLLAMVLSIAGRPSFGPGFSVRRLDALTTGLRRRYQRNVWSTPGMLRRLAAARSTYETMFRGHDVVLSPTLGHVAPKLGYLSPTVPFEELVERLTTYVAFTPIANVTGAPAISLPAGRTDAGVPIGVQVSAMHGDERTLLELAYELEAEQHGHELRAVPSTLKTV